eukprot:1891240-Amphidinium_carterae.1
MEDLPTWHNTLQKSPHLPVRSSPQASRGLLHEIATRLPAAQEWQHRLTRLPGLTVPPRHLA